MISIHLKEELAARFSYTKQIIVDFNRDNMAVALKMKWDQKHKDNPCIIIDGEALKRYAYNSSSNKPAIINLSSNEVYKIYLVGHANPAADWIGSYHFTASYRNIAFSLLPIVKDYKAVINVLGCAAGRGDKLAPHKNTQLSFAAKLHKHLCSLTGGEDTPVIARTHLMGVDTHLFTSNAGHKATSNLTKTWAEVLTECEFIEKQPGSKIIITSDSNSQIKLDAYFHLWKNRVLKKLRNALNRTQSISKKAFLTEWIPQLEMMEPEKLLKTLKKELHDKNSALRFHSNPIVGFFKHAATYTEVQNLVEERERILKSKFTFQDAEMVEDKIFEQGQRIKV